MKFGLQNPVGLGSQRLTRGRSQKSQGPGLKAKAALPRGSGPVIIREVVEKSRRNLSLEQGNEKDPGRTGKKPYDLLDYSKTLRSLCKFEPLCLPPEIHV